MVWPGTRATSKRCATAANKIAASTMAKLFPMQMRGPPPNGKYANLGAADS